ncbi:hypothetical protein DAI22_01g206900 [Oryza sativa Japonica Group]|nr:hypothetical protein DAI22_01g206900 [Oryza sativa Japonica Group]
MSSARSVVSPSAAQVGGGSSARDVEQQKSAAAVGASSPLVHIGDDTLQSWGSKEFKVQVDLSEQDLSCGCKLFEHLGIICSHIIIVMVQYGFTEIPKKCILKRWTKDARDSIPKHLEESYLKDKEAASSRTYRNTLLHKSALDMVRLGGTSSETYEKTVEVLTKLIGELQVMCTSQVDGIGHDVSAGEDSVDVDITDVNEEDILPPEFGGELIT